MKYDDLKGEVSYYIRKIKVLEDWFKFVFTKGYVQGGDGLVARLNEKRPMAHMPTISDLDRMDKAQYVELAEALSSHAQRLDDIRLEVFKTGACPGWLRLGISNVLIKLDAGEISNWTTPFTCGMHDLAKIFGPRHKYQHET
jgi:hypothetical protein